MLRKERVLVLPMHREEMAGGNLHAEYKEAVLEQWTERRRVGFNGFPPLQGRHIRPGWEDVHECRGNSEFRW